MNTTKKSENASSDLSSLPESYATPSSRFTQITGARGDEILVLEEMIGQAALLDPSNWGNIQKINKGRSFTAVVKTSEGDKPIKVRTVRSADNVVFLSFSESFPPPSALENMKKAHFLFKKLRYDDDETVIRVETPLGITKTREYGDVEIYPLPENVKLLRQLAGEDRADAEKALKKYQTLCTDVGGYRVYEHDIEDLEQNIFFRRDDAGRMMLIKTDTEFTEIIDLKKLDENIRSIEIMLSSMDFNPSEYEGARPFKSFRGHVVAEHILNATRLMTPEEKEKFLSPEVAGRLTVSAREFSEKKATNATGGWARKSRYGTGGDFLMILTNELSIASEIVPGQRSQYAIGISDALLASNGDERTFIQHSGAIRGKYQRIRPITSEKDGVLWASTDFRG